MTKPKWERPPMAEGRTPLDKYIATITRRQWRAAMRGARREGLLEAAKYLERTGFDRVAEDVREIAARRWET